MTRKQIFLACVCLAVVACTSERPADRMDGADVLSVSRSSYGNRLEGFWLGQSIANWTGLVTEMDKIGGDGPTGQFYTRDDWGAPDQPNFFSGELSPWSARF